MSWLQRNIFSRKRSASQPAESEQQPQVVADSTASSNSQTQRLEEMEKLLRQKYQQPPESPDPEDTLEDPAELQLLDVDSADGLFAKLSIAEMRRYEQTLQQRIETMRGQMRKVASRHYPELIDAADSAVAMDRSSTKISMRLSSLRTMLENTHRPQQKKPLMAEQDEGGAKAKVYAIAAQVKVLVDTPEQIWKALGAQRFLQAALLYMIAGEIHERLRKQSRGMAEDQAVVVDPLLAFPVIERQWESIAPFREQISSKSRQALGSTDKSFSMECGLSAICAISLLEDDVDAEMACTVFLAHRGESLAPLLESLRMATGELDGKLQELLGRVRQILTDYVAVFGVPDDYSALPGDGVPGGGGQHASWILTTLASICADCDLPISPPLRRILKPSSPAVQPAPGADEASLAKRRSELQQGLRARGRRTSSIAGSVLSSSLLSTAVGDGHVAAGSLPATPWVGERGGVAKGAARSGGAFIVGKYLPQEIAQFRPRFVRLLDLSLQPGAGLSEADEDQAGLASFLDDPPALLRALAAQAQPSLERIARHALGLWWAETLAAVQAAAQAGVARQVASVGDAARVGAALVRWESQGCAWTRGLAWTAVASNPVLAGPAIGSLYASVAEPLLQARARRLHFAAVDAALALPDAFVRGGHVDTAAGHLAWRALGDGAALADLAADVRRADVVPPDVRALGDAVDGALQAAWRAGSEWWRLLSGAAAQPEALVCARHFCAQWQAMARRLDAWAADAGHVAACLRGAWAAAVLADAARAALATDAALVRACWRQLGTTADWLAAGLQRTQRRLLEPWFAHLGRGMGAAWAAQFGALYYQVPRALRADGAATRRDVVRAWVAAGAAAAGHAALRRVAASALALEPRGVSPAVRSLAVATRAQAQAVCGLGPLVASHAEMWDAVGRAVADAMRQCAAGGADECDAAQLRADIRFVCECIGGPTEAYAPLVARIGASGE
ncbi:hypothetical protein GGI18_000959 [Coemansia linderi]|uniref:Uncharacterized protein n=1 Tax=Coemansia linderi TaxID=2663919 RepID=A0ACC1KL59_9FUNG|nr:hypothetical protein GGI18_000959 [Coemansia linderi]